MTGVKDCKAPEVAADSCPAILNRDLLGSEPRRCVAPSRGLSGILCPFPHRLTPVAIFCRPRSGAEDGTHLAQVKQQSGSGVSSDRAETDIEATVDRFVFGRVVGTDILRRIAVRPAMRHTLCVGVDRFAVVAGPRFILPEPLLTPLPNVSVHVEHAQSVRPQATNRPGSAV